MNNFQNKTKIIKVSKLLRVILSVGLFLWMLAAICFFTAIVIPIAILPAVRAGVHLDPPKTYWLCGAILCAALAFVVNLKLFAFFGRLKDGHLFDAQTVGSLDAAGKWWITFWILEGLFYQIGHVIFQIANGWNFGGLFAGLALIFVAWLLKEAQELQEEQELTV